MGGSRPGDTSVPVKDVLAWLENGRRDAGPREASSSARLTDEARQVIGEFIERYNHAWLLERHGYRTPADVRRALTRQAA